MSKVKKEATSALPKEVKDQLAKLATNEAGLVLNKEPLDMAEGEVKKCILYSKYERELDGGRKARYVTLMDVDEKLFYSGSSVLVQALFDVDLYTPLEITFVGKEEKNSGNMLNVFEVRLLND